MQSIFTHKVINGQLKKVQELTYNNGIMSRRIFDKPDDVVPSTVIWVKPTHVVVKPSDVIEHREVQLYNHYFPTLHGEG